MQKTINGATFRKMILAGASSLEQNKEYIDSLNVFPVPDGGNSQYLQEKKNFPRHFLKNIFSFRQEFTYPRLPSNSISSHGPP